MKADLNHAMLASQKALKDKMGVIKNLEDQILELKGEKDQIEFAIEE